MADENPNRNESATAIWARYSQIAFIIPTAVVVGLLLGKLLDYWFHTHWIFLAGIVIGSIAGLTDVIRTVIKQTK